MIGVNNHEFSKVDKYLFLFMFINAVWGFGAFFVLLCFHIAGYMDNEKWLLWWHIEIGRILTIAIIGSVWVCIGGMFDIRKLYKRLAGIDRNVLDDGSVVADHSLAEDAPALQDPNRADDAKAR